MIRFNLFIIAVTLLAFAVYRVFIARERGLNLVVSMTTGITEYTAARLHEATMAAEQGEEDNDGH